jgi:Bacterial low temperature requirement A protein (LtrA)
MPHVNWGDLFFDLFYVAAAFNLAVILKESLSWEGFLYFICCYIPIMAQWNEKLVYDARFAPEDNLYHRSLEFVHLLLLGTAVQHIRPVDIMQRTCSNSTQLVFSTCLVLMNLLGMKRNQDVHVNVMGGQEARHHATADIVRRVCALIPFSLSTIVAGHDYFILGGNGGGQVDVAKNNIPILLCLVGYICEQAYVLMDVFVLIPNSGRDFREIRVPLNIIFTL